MESLMPRNQVDQLVADILKALPGTKDLDAAVDDVAHGLEVLVPGLSAKLSEEIAEAKHIVEKQFEKLRSFTGTRCCGSGPCGTSARNRPIFIGRRFGTSF